MERASHIGIGEESNRIGIEASDGGDLSELVLRIVEAVGPEQIILFGSRARGEANAESDLDLLIVEREEFSGRSRWGELQTIRRAIRDVPVAKDILLYSRSEVEHWRLSMNHVVAHALREGKSLYERS
ncbi:MAG: nucleotidyltransferase domain-containing protein [Magnetococcales bacterium]|nr:nucleotidyltransferase domain-containing protein [Magnetococcales bacterium]